MGDLNILEILVKANEARDSGDPEMEELGDIIHKLLETIFPGQVKPWAFCDYCGEPDEQHNLDTYWSDDMSRCWRYHPACHHHLLQKMRDPQAGGPA